MLKYALMALAIAALAFGIGPSPAQAQAPAAPGAVTNLELHAARYTITATWEAPDPKPTGRYIAEIFTGSSATGTAVQTRKVRPGNVKTSFPELAENTQYTVSIKAQNKNDEGETAGTAVTATTTTLTLPPRPGPVTSLKLGKFTSNSMVAFWDPPNPAPTGPYNIFAQELDASDQAVRTTREFHVAKHSRSTLIEGLKADTKYKVTVETVNRNKAGITLGGVATKDGTTLAAVSPPGAVTSLAVDKVTGDRIVVTWTAPSPAPTARYVVQLFEGSNSSPEVTDYRPANATRAVFHRLSGGATLKPGTEYTVSVKARNKVKGGDPIAGPAATVTATTVAIPDAPGAVTNLALGKITSNSMVATWTAPSPAPTGSYIVELFKGSDSSPTIALNRAKGATKAAFTGLEAATSYTVKVKAQNENSAGKTAGTQVTKTASTLAAGTGLPGQPTGIDFSTAYNTSDSTKYTMTVTWNAPASTGGKAITKYHVVILKLGKWDRSEQEFTKDEGRVAKGETTASSRTYTHSTAEVDVTYQVKVRAENSAGKGPWATQQIAVSPKP